MNWNNHIVLDDCTTWPKALIDCVSSNEEATRSYLLEEQRVDKLAETDLTLRSFRPPNRYRSRFEDTVDRIADIIASHSFIGFHCARLTKQEQAIIRTAGLQPLSRVLVEERIERLLEQKSIRSSTAQRLLSKNQVSDSSRAGHVCLFHGVSTLRDESGLYRLFRCWGGEAIYILYEKTPAIIRELATIGVPCIVIASLSPHDLDPIAGLGIGGLGERILKSYLHAQKGFGHCQDFDSFVKHPVLVLRIVSLEEESFESLTGYSRWKMR